MDVAAHGKEGREQVVGVVPQSVQPRQQTASLFQHSPLLSSMSNLRTAADIPSTGISTSSEHSMTTASRAYSGEKSGPRPPVQNSSYLLPPGSAPSSGGFAESTSSSFSTRNHSSSREGQEVNDHLSIDLRPLTLDQGTMLPALAATANTSSNRNSTGSTSSSQTSSGFESAKTNSSDGSNLVNSLSSSSCTSSNLINNSGSGNFAIDFPSSRVSSGGGSTTSGRCSTYDSMDCYGEVGYGSLTPTGSCSQKSHSSRAGGRQQQPTSSRVNIGEMMAKGIPESEIIAEWLTRLCLAEYLSLFITQGYDLVSISRITPEDLTTLGISNPQDRKRLVQDIQKWNIVDVWPSIASPDSGIRDWLMSIGLTQYIDLFESQGYLTMHEIEKITWEDLEDIGVKKLGHMKRICLALKKLKLSRTPTAASSTQHYQPYNQTQNSTLNRRHSQGYQPTSIMSDTVKQRRPVVQVLPNQQHPKGPTASTETIYNNSCFGMGDEVKGPPRLNLYRTSQILSDLSDLPKSVDEEDPSLVIENNYSSWFYSHHCPPPPAPIPYTDTAGISLMYSNDGGCIEGYRGNRQDGRVQLSLAQPSMPKIIPAGAQFDNPQHRQRRADERTTNKESFNEMGHMLRNLSSELDNILVVNPTSPLPPKQQHQKQFKQ